MVLIPSTSVTGPGLTRRMLNVSDESLLVLCHELKGMKYMFD